jgi:predicted nucleic acid-binding protein
MEYQEKINAKIEYAERKAEELKTESEEFFKKGFCERTGIPMGQPILIGHHSEQRHRNAIKRYDNQMKRAINNSKYAEKLKERAERLKNNSVISSDNPEAVNLLKEKLKGLEIKREKIKEYNKEQRKKGEKPADAYILANLSGNIKSVKDRIIYLEKKQNIQEIEETINGVILKVDKEANRIKLFFDGKPNEEVRTTLKSRGYRWSGLNGCWQCFLHNWKISEAREILKEFKGVY